METGKLDTGRNSQTAEDMKVQRLLLIPGWVRLVVK